MPRRCVIAATTLPGQALSGHDDSHVESDPARGYSNGQFSEHSIDPSSPS